MEGWSSGNPAGLSPLMVMPLLASGSAATGNNPLLLLPSDDYDTNVIKAKIMSHPHYPRLLSAYVNCHKVGAPPEVVARLEEACASSVISANAGVGGGEDPALDQFMEAYCEMLTKYEQELAKPFKEAMLFLSRIDAQFKSLSLPHLLLPKYAAISKEMAPQRMTSTCVTTMSTHKPKIASSKASSSASTVGTSVRSSKSSSRRGRRGSCPKRPGSSCSTGGLDTTNGHTHRSLKSWH
ncbi:hypothetical protein HPP92_011345 [Vanilla planifolia]|uniref:Uncharacterized protein n=1 Tax=Vanilla planifolia TaxID=51239 RepID=A0A835R0I7_VANPL|nr:hypothetical protein HPP92_011345 [Vanilla planifolia]